MQTKCEKIQEMISLYIDNELSVDEQILFETHIYDCDSCKRELEGTKKMVSILESIEDVDLPENFHTELISKIIAEENQKAEK